MYWLVLVPRNGDSSVRGYHSERQFAQEVSAWQNRIHTRQWQGEIAAFIGDVVPLSAELHVASAVVIAGRQASNTAAVSSPDIAKSLIFTEVYDDQEDEIDAEEWLCRSLGRRDKPE